MAKKPNMTDILRDVFEAAYQADADLCGDQREFLLPRLNRIRAGLMMWFAQDAVEAMQQAKDAWGNKLVGD